MVKPFSCAVPRPDPGTTINVSRVEHERDRLYERLRAQAEFQFRAALDDCHDCRDYHALYGYTRLIQAKSRFDAGHDSLERLTRLHCPHRGHALIAGAADSCLFALVAKATSGLEATITVADRCRTPLRACRHDAARRGLAVTTVEADIAQAPLDGGPYDMALAHLTLMFVPVAAQAAFLRNLGRSLVKGGTLILVHWLRPDRLASDHATEARGYATSYLAALAAGGVSLPEDETRFRRRIEAEYVVRRGRDDYRTDFQTVEAHLAAADFSIRERIDARQPSSIAASDAARIPVADARTFIASCGR